MRSQLQRQLGYLERSADLFDLGYLDEAIRIATSLRVLFHDRPRDPSTQGSVLKLLGRRSVNLRTTCTPCTFNRGVFSYDGYLHLPGNLRPWQEYLQGKSTLLTVEDWWSQIIFIVDGNRVSRRDLVLWAAEKDGGAHSDAHLHPAYEALFRMWTLASFDSCSQPPTVIPHQHLFALRRFALEVLASDELLALSSSDTQPLGERTIVAFPKNWAPIMHRALDISFAYFGNLTKQPSDRDYEKTEKALQLVDEIRMPLSEWVADSYTRSAKYDQALAVYNQIRSIAPMHQHSLFGLGYVQHRLGNYIAAEEFLLQAIASAPSHLPSICELADLYLHQDAFAKARPLYEQVLKCDPEHFGAKANYKILILSENALEPERASVALLELGRHFLLLGLKEEAASTFERLLKLEPENPEANAGLREATAASAASERNGAAPN